MSLIAERGRMQFEIPENAHLQIIVGSPAPAARTLPALLDTTPPERPAPRSRHRLLKGGLIVMLLAASFAGGDYFASRSRAPEPTHPTAALPRPAPAGEQHTFPDRPLPREATAPVQTGQVPTEFRQQLHQPPTVIPAPGQAPAPQAAGSSPLQPPDRSPGVAGSGSAPAKNPFGLEN